MADLLQEIRDRTEYMFDAWRDVYRLGDEDMRYVLGDPWDPDEKRAREELGRPCLSLDELGQYINQRINDVRQNKRAIKIGPEAAGANDRDAELRADIIRTIEGKGGIQAYISGYENAVQRGFGFWAVGKRYVSEESFDQELYLRHLPNPKNVLIDPDAIEPAASDMRYAAIFQDIPRNEFRKRFPRAQLVDFTPDHMTRYPTWVKERTIMVCEAWKIIQTPAKLLLVGDETNPQTLFADRLPDGVALGEGGVILPNGSVLPILRERDSEHRQVVKYLTNGLEILEETEWEGRWIPIVPCWGRQYWVDQGAGSKRVLESLIRKARHGQMLHNYLATAKMEAIGQVLKAPYIGYEGQTEGHEEEWQMANRRPLSILLVKPVLDATGTAVLPLPQRNPWEPALQGYEIADESAKRSIQNAMGMYNASVGRTDASAKSGVAIKALDLQSDQGNFHFIDNFDQAIMHTGEIINDMIPYVYDTPRQILLRKVDDTTATARINTPMRDESGKTTELSTRRGRYGVSITTGPSYQSQREMASEFVDLLVQNLNNLPVPPDVRAKLLALSISLKQLGPIGDQMVQLLDPTKDGEQNISALQAKLAQMTEMTTLLTQQVNQLTEEREAKMLELQSKERIASLEASTKLEIERIKATAQAELQTVQDSLAQLQMQLSGLLELSRLQQTQTQPEPGTSLPVQQP